MLEFPLVSIGIPTYNRSRLLGRAIESAISQDYPNLEILISDNVSTDDTAAVCAAYAARDARVRYVRQIENRGATGNFRAVFEATGGEFFAWLGDDDWMDPGFVGRCVQCLIDKPDHSVAGGRVRYYRDESLVSEEPPTNLLDESPYERVRNFYRQVSSNGIFYGVIRRRCLAQTLINKRPGFDWLVAGALASCGKAATLDGIALHRALGGATKDYISTADSLGIPRFIMLGDVSSYTAISFFIFTQTAWTCRAFSNMGILTRHRLAIRAAVIVMRRFVTWRIRQSLRIGRR